MYSAPEFLIIHLKRFKHTEGGFFTAANQKIKTNISFPVKNLDIGSYVQTSKGASVVYDLYAVSNHFGNLKNGHYTANAQNPVTKAWH